MHGAVFRTKGHRQTSGGGRPARTNESRWPSRRPLTPRGRPPTARAALVRASRSIGSDVSGMRVRKRCRFTAGAVWSGPRSRGAVVKCRGTGAGRLCPSYRSEGALAPAHAGRVPLVPQRPRVKPCSTKSNRPKEEGHAQFMIEPWSCRFRKGCELSPHGPGVD